MPCGKGKTLSRRKDWLSLGALILANLVPLGGAIFAGWDAATLLVVYWAENLVVGFYTVLRMIFAKAQHPLGHLRKFFLVPFFCFHYGAFCAVHGFFLVALFKIGGDLHELRLWGGLFSVFGHLLRTAPQMLVWPMVGLAFSHGVSFVENYLRGGEYERTSAQAAVGRAYQRIGVMHIAVIGSGFFAMNLGSPRGLVVLIVAVKLVLDLLFHIRSHARRADGESREGVLDAATRDTQDAGERP